MKLFKKNEEKATYLKRIKEYEELQYDYKCQCIENGKKQDQIIDLKHKIKDLEEELGKVKLENKFFREVLNDRKHNTRK